MFLQGCLRRAPQGARKASWQCVPQPAGLEPLTGTSPGQVARSHACRGLTTRRQAASVTDVCLGWHQRATECRRVSVYSVHVCCPSIHSSGDSRSKRVRKSMAGESNKRESEDDRGLCGSSVQCLSLTRTSPQASLTGFQWSCTTEASGPLSP